MTERTVRSVARELASAFYEEASGDLFGTEPDDKQRSKRYRETYPTLEHFLKGYQVGKDGRIKKDQPGWKFFVTLARARLVQMLADPNLRDNLKAPIYKALLEENEKSTSPAAQELLQRRLGSTPTFGSN